MFFTRFAKGCDKAFIAQPAFKTGSFCAFEGCAELTEHVVKRDAGRHIPLLRPYEHGNVIGHYRLDGLAAQLSLSCENRADMMGVLLRYPLFKEPEGMCRLGGFAFFLSELDQFGPFCIGEDPVFYTYNEADPSSVSSSNSWNNIRLHALSKLRKEVGRTTV